MKKIGFTTCVQLGETCLLALLDEGIKIDLAITLPDEKARKKSGRIYLDEICHRHHIPLIKSANINDEVVQRAVREAEIDWLFVIGWSQIVREPLLGLPREGVIGIHPTLLPEGRGRAAIPWAIIKGLERTGVTLFKIDQGVDTGPIIDQMSIELDSTTTATELYQAVDELHVALIKANAHGLVNGTSRPEPQDDSLATEWPGRRPEDGNLLNCNSVGEAERLVRATTHPYPGAFVDRDGQRINVWRASIGAPDDGTEKEHNGVRRWRTDIRGNNPRGTAGRVTP